MVETKAYEQFKSLEGNAPIKIQHLRQLTEAIRKKNLLHARPILVNGKMEVVDGQHRLEAARILGVPIYYTVIENLDLADMSTLNSNQRNWKMEHYLTLYADHIKNENYVRFRDWLQESEITFNQGIGFFLKEHSINDVRHMFKNGEFIFDSESTKHIDEYKVFLNKANSISRGTSRHWKQQCYVRAFVCFLANPEVQVDRFFEQLDRYPFLLSPRRKKHEMLELFYEIYNYKRHIKIQI